MGRKIRAAKASLVAAFLAAGGAASANAVHAKAAKQTATVTPASINWGDQLIRFLKLDGFPDYLKLDNSAALANSYKEQLLSDASTLYIKYGSQVSDVLALYQKPISGPLEPILSGLESFYKEQDPQPLLDYVKSSDEAMSDYLKFESFFSALEQAAPDGAFQFFYKETGIAGNPLADLSSGGDGGAVT